MMDAWNKMDGTKTPSRETIDAYINNDLFNELCGFIEKEYSVKPLIEYSGCSLQPGWNIKYKKAGRGLCTLYPKEGYVTALIVIGERERAETELALPMFTDYLQRVYRETKAGMGQKWLMIDVTDDDILNDVKTCIAIRRGIKAAKK